MEQQNTSRSHPLRILVVSTYVPRECGIATYAEDVIRAVELHGAFCQVAAMEQSDRQFSYEDRVITTVCEDRLEDYLALADLINHSWFDVVSLQHEFGIYGGEDAAYVTRFLEALHVPVVATLHTIVQHPTPGARRTLQAIAKHVAGIVTMNGMAVPLLRDVYGAETGKIHVIHHGSPPPTHERGDFAKQRLQLDGQQVLSSFGLINPSKGLEYMVQAMPRIVAEQPDAMYYVLGKTHPVIKEENGEVYRGMLENLAYELGVHDHVRFVDRYLTKEELVNYLLATDTYVTPYRNMEQVTSGTLAYAVGNGCPVVSTPYLHAQYLLAEERGLLVPAENPEQLAKACVQILGDPEMQLRMQQTNWEYGKNLYWPRVGMDYLQVFQRAALR
ncbi:MAG: glycosyltransferase family 4 protein [Armatimonadota bacterium]